MHGESLMAVRRHVNVQPRECISKSHIEFNEMFSCSAEMNSSMEILAVGVMKEHG